MDRMAIKKRRIKLMDEQSRLEEERCEGCRGRNVKGCDCPAAVRIREIGKELDALAQRRRKVPEKLTVEAYHYLKDQDWEDHQIQKHYGINKYDLTFWKQGNGLLRNAEPIIKEEKKMTAKPTELTYGEMKALRKQGKSWNDIAQRMGVSAPTAKTRFEKLQQEHQVQPSAAANDSELHKKIEELRNENNMLTMELVKERDKQTFSGDLSDRVNDLTKQLQRAQESYEELMDEHKTLQQQNAYIKEDNAKLRKDVHLLQERLECSREDLAANEDFLLEQKAHERKLAVSLMDYIRGLEAFAR